MRDEAEDIDLHRMDPTGRFTDRAEDYVKFRPTYPSAAIDCILKGRSEPDHAVAADIGAGTGISARLLADRGVRVLAIEPNPAMRAAAEFHAGVEFRAGTAEATLLPNASVDLVVCAQAFHWFRPPEALAEFHRILRPRERLVLMWNHRDRKDDLTRGFIEAIHAVHGEHPAERATFDPDVIQRGGWFSPPVLETFPHEQTLDARGLIGRALSASYVPKDGPGFEDLRTRLLDVFERHRDDAGVVTMRYVTQVYRAERR